MLQVASMVDKLPEVQDLNIMEKMLQKGDDLRPKYRGYDFSKLDAQQHFWLRQLSWFTHYR